jgi:cytochrome c556
MALLVKLSAAAIVALGVAAVGTAGLAQDKETAIKSRQDFMKAQSADNKAINDYAKGMGDKAAALKAVDDLIARSDKIATLFPAGTSSTDFPGKSNAKAVIWTDHDNFVKIPVALKALELKTKTAIETGAPDQVGEAAAAQGKNGCGACHSTYREPMQH